MELDFDENIIEHAFEEIEYDPESLEHYGRLGMKWGQHIFGKIQGAVKKYKNKQKMAKVRKAKAAKKKVAEAEAKKKAAEEKAIANKKAKASKTPKGVLKNRELFSPEEVDDLIKDFNRRDTLKNLSKNDFDRGVKYIQGFANAAESGIKGWNSVARTYNAVKKWQNPTIPSSKLLPIIDTQQQSSDKDDKKK